LTFKENILINAEKKQGITEKIQKITENIQDNTVIKKNH